MHVKLNLNGSVDTFVTYLKNFAKIRPSLLIEIDTTQRAFIAKTFSEDKASVRFSAVSFEDCNMSVVEHDGDTTLGKNRIKAAIIQQLPKFIRIIERFGSDLDDKGNCNFDINVEYGELKNQDNTTDFAATSITFSSNILKMKMEGFRISELKYLPDDVFNNSVFNVEDSVDFVLPSSAISSIIKTSDIVKIDPKKDALIFYLEGTEVYVKDNTGKNSQPNFIYKIGELTQSTDYPIRIAIFREKFIQMMDKCEDDYKVILGHHKQPTGDYAVDRILFESTNNNTKIVISIINEG